MCDWMSDEVRIVRRRVPPLLMHWPIPPIFWEKFSGYDGTTWYNACINKIIPYAVHACIRSCMHGAHEYGASEENDE